MIVTDSEFIYDEAQMILDQAYAVWNDRQSRNHGTIDFSTALKVCLAAYRKLAARDFAENLAHELTVNLCKEGNSLPIHGSVSAMIEKNY